MREKYPIRDGAPKPPQRAYFHHEDLEEYQGGAGMWRVVSGASRQAYVDDAAALMADPLAFQTAMRRVLREWPNSVSAALTTPGANQRAWLGHAGCYLATGSPEECTRQGWHTLNEPQQYAANAAADIVIAYWHRTTEAAAYRQQLDLFGESWDDRAEA